MKWATNFLQVYSHARTSTSCRKSTFQDSGTSHLGDAIKINVDAALPLASTTFSMSMVARDSSGSCVWWQRKVMVGRPSPTDAEATALLRGIQVALAKRWSCVIFETDCLPIYQYLVKGRSTLVSYGATLDSCFELCLKFSSYSFSFVRRSGNSIAHVLASLYSLSCTRLVKGPWRKALVTSSWWIGICLETAMVRTVRTVVDLTTRLKVSS